MNIWNFLKEMEQIQSQLSSISNFRRGEGFPRMAFLPGVSSRHFPLINVVSNEDSIQIEALAPGLDTESLKVSALRDKLTISGEKKKVDVGNEKYHRCERSAGRFTRTIELSSLIDPDKVQAAYSCGILTVTLPKAEEAKPRQISIKLS